MKSIRTFIICSAMMLSAWLTASYTTQMDSSPQPGAQPETVTTQTGSEAGHQDQKTGVSSLAIIK